MITLFASPKPFRGHVNIIQRNAIKSWTLLKPKPEIILLGDDEGVKEICDEFDLVRVAEIERNEYGTPLVRSVFQIGQERASQPIVCYVNADIILMSDFLPAVEAVAAHMSEFLIVGQRWNVDIEKEWNFASASWEVDLRTLLARAGVLHPQTAMDFFAFPRGMYTDIPPLLIGRLGWDNWLVWRATSNGTPIVDATAAIVIVHQNHDYAAGTITRLGAESVELGPEEQRKLAAGKIQVLDSQWVELGPEAQLNCALTPDEKGALDIWAATWTIDQQGVISRRPLTLTPAYLKYRLKWVAPVRWPVFGKLSRAILSVWQAIRRNCGPS